MRQLPDPLIKNASGGNALEYMERLARQIRLRARELSRMEYEDWRVGPDVLVMIIKWEKP